MKRNVLLLTFLLAGVLCAFSQTMPVSQCVQLQVRYFDPSGVLEGPSRGPMAPLTIGLDDHTLYMSNVGFDCTLQLLDENDEVVYTTFVYANTSTVVLPADLTGTYKIELVEDERCFWGYIDL